MFRAVLSELCRWLIQCFPYAFGAKLDDVLSQSSQEFATMAARHATSETSTSFSLAFGDAIVGTIGAFIEAERSNRSFICALWVNPSHRGSGAAAMLLETAKKWLADRSASEVHAWVADSNSRAINFYRKAGFVQSNQTQFLPSNPAEIETLWSCAI